MPAKYPVTYAEDLGLKSLKDVEAALLHQDPDGYGKQSRGSRVETPTSCVQWMELREAGFEPATTRDEAPNAYAFQRCGTLALLNKAQAAERSFVRDLVLDRTLLSFLPAAVATAWSNSAVASRARATAAGTSFVDFDPKAKVMKSTLPSELRVLEDDGENFVRIELAARGDFNADKLDDVVLAVTNGAMHGSAFTMRLMVLTRDDNDKVLRQVEAIDLYPEN